MGAAASLSKRIRTGSSPAKAITTIWAVPERAPSGRDGLKRMNVVADEAEIGLEEEVSVITAASRESKAPLLAAPWNLP